MAEHSQNNENGEKIKEMEESAYQLQKQGKYIECLELLEEILNMKRQVYGELSEQYQKSSQKLCELCNLIAMIFLQKDKYDVCMDFLQKAQLLCHNSLEFKAVTMNNFACYYRKIGKLKLAMEYLKNSLEIEIKLNNQRTLADTHLNMCAILSQLQKHEEALQHALMSVTLLQQEFMDFYSQEHQDNNNNNDNNNNYNNNDNEEDEENNPSNRNKMKKERVVILSIAYHNMGVEFEYLKRYDEAIKTYLKAVSFSKDNLQPNDDVVIKLTSVLAQATQQIENQKKQEYMKSQKQKKANNKGQVQKSYQQASNLYKQPSSKLMNKRQFLGYNQEHAAKGYITDHGAEDHQHLTEDQ